MYTPYTSKTGEQELEEGKLDNFLNAIGSDHDHVWDERISNTMIQIDGSLAQVWTDYTFYIGADLAIVVLMLFKLLKTRIITGDHQFN